MAIKDSNTIRFLNELTTNVKMLPEEDIGVMISSRKLVLMTAFIAVGLTAASDEALLSLAELAKKHYENEQGETPTNQGDL